MAVSETEIPGNAEPDEENTVSKKGYQTYQTQEVMTASPAKLVALLYERAIGSLKAVVRAIEADDIESRWKANKKAIDIVSHLLMTLDIERGGNIAANLDQLYRFMLTRLTQVDIRNDAQIARDVINLLEPLHESWKQLAAQGTEMPPEAPKVPDYASAQERPAGQRDAKDQDEPDKNVPGQNIRVSA